MRTNKRPYKIKDEEHYNNLVKRANELTKRDNTYWTVIWRKEMNVGMWWLTCLHDPRNQSPRR